MDLALQVAAISKLPEGSKHSQYQSFLEHSQSALEKVEKFDPTFQGAIELASFMHNVSVADSKATLEAMRAYKKAALDNEDDG